MNRRHLLLSAGLAAVGLAAHKAAAETFEVVHSDEEWRKLLSPEAYSVLRKEGTEYPYTSPLEQEHRKGSFACAGCGQALFSSETKFDSGTGWPSFYQPISETAVATRIDGALMMTRTEVHCARCGGHLGHVFEDGPPPTGLRYCMNGVAMTFTPET
ncbi:peptide-methionine (R)-S-oxide reductase MsrB [Rhodobacter capsulatus]|uniref:peptide-methionine (R)-S-oxide reductase n=1 Tax=Rhodobacter capsulatus TaxID=1061 RepID=A0A1G7BN94_RHOCA|nr:peptide-methionine (R)-S-oxide reductase MsrB [Rhodobacter capsulatus]WER09080.1 peptide-methionine (R)-S-oxide reductase MsrB [Rhodobacter capsulatus]SDE28150.1 peptide-methionine (R)-S-oxide reductase [Rhodobacter capsulatus]